MVMFFMKLIICIWSSGCQWKNSAASTQKPARAIAELQRASSLDPTGVRASPNPGLSDDRTAQVDEVLATYRRALALVPHEPEMRGQAAYSA